MKPRRIKIELGDTAKDRISGFEGVVVCISNWFNGCQRVSLKPQKLKEDGSLIDMHTFDAEELELVEKGEGPIEKETGGPPIAPAMRADPK